MLGPGSGGHTDRHLKQPSRKAREAAMSTKRPQSLHEELANAASHVLGLLLAAVAMSVLAADLLPVDSMRHTGALVFALTMLLAYMASSVYHAMPAGRVKDRLQRVDHAAIYLFIAGSYTPFALREVQGDWSWTVFGAVWAMATLGMALKLLNRLRHPGLSVAIFFAFGWVALLAAKPVVDHLSTQGVTLVIGGGLAYTAGMVFLLLDERIRYAHLVWHLFALAGSTCHFLAVWRFLN
jgi:hemolysin III